MGKPITSQSTFFVFWVFLYFSLSLQCGVKIAENLGTKIKSHLELTDYALAGKKTETLIFLTSIAALRKMSSFQLHGFITYII